MPSAQAGARRAPPPSADPRPPNMDPKGGPRPPQGHPKVDPMEPATVGSTESAPPSRQPAPASRCRWARQLDDAYLDAAASMTASAKATPTAPEVTRRTRVTATTPTPTRPASTRAATAPGSTTPTATTPAPRGRRARRSPRRRPDSAPPGASTWRRRRGRDPQRLPLGPLGRWRGRGTPTGRNRALPTMPLLPACGSAGPLCRADCRADCRVAAPCGRPARRCRAVMPGRCRAAAGPARRCRAVMPGRCRGVLAMAGPVPGPLRGANGPDVGGLATARWGRAAAQERLPCKGCAR